MNQKEIRTYYSGLIVFAAKLVSVATGTAFTLIVARSVTQNEYGNWGTLNIILPYFTLLSAAVPFWTMRFVARDKPNSTKTGVFANGGIGLAAVLVYFALLPIIVPAFKLENYVLPLSLMALQIIEIYMITAFEASLQAQHPHFVGHGLVIGEVVKVSLASVLIMSLGYGVVGAVLSVATAFAVRTLFYSRLVLKELKLKLETSYIKEWLKGSALNVYNVIGDRIAAIIFLMLSIYGGEIATSYYQAAMPIANIITYSTFLAFALVPKLLSEGNMKDVTSTLKIVLMFAIPMTIGVVAMPESYLLILNPVYGEAALLLAILAVDSLIITISSVFSYVIFGIEKADEKAKIPFSQLAKSRLFKIFSLPYVHSVITLPVAYYVTTRLVSNDPLSVAVYLIAINTAAHLAMLVVTYVLMQRAARVEIPWKNIAKYTVSSAAMAILLFLVHPTRAFLTIAAAAAGGTVYFAILLALDTDSRRLIGSILAEVKSIFRKRI